jgi:hypothetical protein
LERLSEPDLRDELDTSGVLPVLDTLSPLATLDGVRPLLVLGRTFPPGVLEIPESVGNVFGDTGVLSPLYPPGILETLV